MDPIALPTYTVHKAETAPTLDDGWEHPSWARAEIAIVKHFRPESSSHRPTVSVRLLHGKGGIHGIFQVHDQYVRSVATQYQGKVWKDSCVEFFVQPKPEAGYFNLEMNAGGTHLCWYITDPTRKPDGFKSAMGLPPEIGQTILIRSTMPKVVEPEIKSPTSWEVKFFVPLSVLEKYVGPLGELRGQSWRGNFYKCADETSHPHWAAWSPVDQLNFHLPRCFGKIIFD